MQDVIQLRGNVTRFGEQNAELRIQNLKFIQGLLFEKTNFCFEEFKFPAVLADEDADHAERNNDQTYASQAIARIQP
jgi:hypothetical protein